MAPPLRLGHPWLYPLHGYRTSWCEALAPLRLEMFGEAYYKPLEEIDRKVILEFARRGSLHILPENNSEVMNIDMEVSNNGSDVLNNSIL